MGHDLAAKDESGLIEEWNEFAYENNEMLSGRISIIREGIKDQRRKDLLREIEKRLIQKAQQRTAASDAEGVDEVSVLFQHVRHISEDESAEIVKSMHNYGFCIAEYKTNSPKT